MQGGRPRELNDELVARMHKSGVPIMQIAAWFGKTRGAVYVALKRAKGLPSTQTERIAELEEALRGLMYPHGHFTPACKYGRCSLRCRRALAALRKV